MSLSRATDVYHWQLGHVHPHGLWRADTIAGLKRNFTLVLAYGVIPSTCQLVRKFVISGRGEDAHPVGSGRLRAHPGAEGVPGGVAYARRNLLGAAIA